MFGVPLPPPRLPVPSAIVRRAPSADARAEEELVERFHPGLLAHLTRRVRDREAARELANDVLMAVVQALRDGRIREPERLPGYVYGTARNLANNFLRMRRARPPGEPLDPDIAVVELGERAEDGERLARVRAALDLLRDTERQILLMTIEGLKPGTIASHLGVTSQVVRARKARAMRKLEAHVGRASSGCGPMARDATFPSRVVPARRPWAARRAFSGPRRS